MLILHPIIALIISVRITPFILIVKSIILVYIYIFAIDIVITRNTRWVAFFCTIAYSYKFWILSFMRRFNHCSILVVLCLIIDVIGLISRWIDVWIWAIMVRGILDMVLRIVWSIILARNISVSREVLSLAWRYLVSFDPWWLIFSTISWCLNFVGIISVCWLKSHFFGVHYFSIPFYSIVTR